jgi:hypothetical protein
MGSTASKFEGSRISSFANEYQNNQIQYFGPEGPLSFKDNLPHYLIPEDYQIESILHCKSDLWPSQLTQAFVHHAFIVIKSGGWYCSIEKNDEGIIVQKNKKLEMVRDMCLKKRRNGVDKIREVHEVFGNFKKLTTWLRNNYEIISSYI